MPISTVPRLLASTSAGTCTPSIAWRNLKASMLAEPVAVLVAPPRLKRLLKSERISVNSCLADAMASAVAVGPGGVPPLAGAAVQAVPVQARLACATVSALAGTEPLSAGVASTLVTAAPSAADTSTPPVACSFRLVVLADAASASVTQRVFSAAVPVVQPRAPSAASLDTAVSMTASCCADVDAVAAVDGEAAASGLKPSSWLTVDSDCAALVAVMPPVARLAAAAAISLKGVTAALTLTVPLPVGTVSARSAKPAGRGWVPSTSSRWVVLPSALAATRTT